MTNPYAPPSTESISGASDRTNRLLYIWIWLPTAILGAMLATPADIFLIVPAMAFALPCYLIGVAWASDLAQSHRWTLTIVCAVVAAWLAAVIWLSLDLYFVAVATLFAIVNVTLGFKSCVGVVHNRRRIFAALGASYAIGVLLGPLGVIIFAVPSVLLANRAPAPGSG